MVINFAEPAREIRPLKLTKNGRVKHLQGLRYTKCDRLNASTSLDEAFGRGSRADVVFGKKFRF